MMQIEVEMKKIIRVVSFLVVPMFFIFVYLSNDLLAVFGEAYVSKDASLALIILAFSFLIDAVSGPIGSILTMTKYAKLSLYNNIISLLINIILNTLLIKRFGIIGVSIATGISIIVNNLISILQVKFLLGIFSYDSNHLIQVLIMGLLNFFMGSILVNLLNFENLYLRIFVFGIIIYIVNFVLLGLFFRKEIIKTLARRR